MSGKRVGIMSGNFNPIHLGQMIIGENAIDTYNLDEILFVPHGALSNNDDYPDDKTRINLIGIAIEDNNHFALSTIEIENKNSNTAETIQILKSKNPDNIYYFIIGADEFISMEKLPSFEYIFSAVEIIVSPRFGTDTNIVMQKVKEYSDKYSAKIHNLAINCVDLSASIIRQRVKNNKSIRYMVHYKVIEFINKNNIYKEKQ